MSETTEQETGEAEAEAPPPPEVNPEIEIRARNMGWAPRGEYNGEPDRWIDAQTFVERGERMLPLLQERNRALDRSVTELKERMTDQQKMLGDLVTRTRRADKIGYERAMRELQQQRVAAVSQGDTEAFNKAEAEIQSLGPPPEPEPPPQPPPQAGVNPVVSEWVRRNTWFNTDRMANAAAVAALSQVELEMPGQDLTAHLIEVENRVAQAFPQHFPHRQRQRSNGADYEETQQPRRSAQQMVTPSSSAPERRPGPRSFEAIPAEHRKEYEKQRKMLEGKGEPFTKQEYADYYWDAEGAP